MGRAAELAKSNAALRRSISKLADVPDVEAAMVEAMSTAAEIIDSCGGALGVYLPEERGFRNIFQVIDGKRVGLEGLSYESRLYTLDEAPIRLAWEQFHSGDGVLWCPPDSCYLSEDSRNVILQQGFSSSVLVALRRGTECIGYIGFFSRRSEELPVFQRELLRAIADQISLMLELSRLARLSESAAVTREREIATQERAAELERANLALRKGIAGLGRLDNLSHFLGEMLRAAVETAGAHTGGVVLIDDTAQTYRVHPLMRSHGGFEPTESALTAAHPLSPGIRALFHDVAAASTAWMTVGTDTRMDPEFIDFHESEGNVAVAHIPMRAGDRLLGILCLGFPTRDPHFEKEFSLLRSLADQMAMAVEMVRLSDEAKSAALARGEEKAAREHAAELTRANEALRKGVDGLVRLDNLELFLREMLKAAIETSGAQGGAVALLAEDWQTYRFAALMLRGGSFAESSSPLLQPIKVFPALRTYLAAMVDSCEAWPLPPEDPLHATETRAFHQSEQNRALRHIPMLVNERLIGWLGLGFADPDPELGHAHTLLRVLADQMTMAVEMLRLSEEAKSAAIAREREQSAQERLAELERVNHLLRQSAYALAQARTPDEICELFLLQAVVAMQGTAGGLLELVEGTEHRFAALVQGDQVVPKHLWEHLPIVIRNAEITRRDGKGIMARLLKGEDAWFPIDEEFASWAPESAAYHRQHGNAAIVLWPFYFGKVVKGNIGIAFSHTEPLTDTQRETLKALSSQASLALELSAMTAEVEIAAVAREREIAAQARALELSRANEQLALRDRLLTASAKALEQLISAEDFSSGVKDALRRIGETASLSRVQVLMEIKTPSGEWAHELAHEWWDESLVSQRTMGHLVFPNASYQEVMDHLYKGERWWARTENWPIEVQPTLRELGIVWTGVVPIFVQQRYVGMVAFDQCRSGRDWTEAEIDALTIAARGIGAALSQERMAAELVNERERAAQDRAAELVKANRALRSSVDDLVTQTTTDGILTSLLKQAVDISAATSGAILSRVSGSEFEYVTIYVDGAVCSSREILVTGTNAEMRLASRLDPTGHFEGLSRGEARWLDVNDASLAIHLQRSTSFHNQARNKRLYDFPYKVAGEVLGYLGLAFADHEPPSETIQETIKALATQVGLALEFRRISEQVERTAVMEERNKFARDLHDTLAQGYAAILMQLGAADQFGPASPALLPVLDRIEDLARSNLAEARRTVHELRTSERVRAPLVARIYEVVRGLESAFSRVIHTSVAGRQRPLPSVVEDELFLIAQESLTNAMKHAEASDVKIEVEFADLFVKLKVKDNGIGFAAKERLKPNHFGLQTMGERSQRISAALTIISEPGFGTEVVSLWKEHSRES